MPKSGFSSDYGFFAGQFGFLGFLGREAKTDLPESVSSGENPLPIAGVGRVGRFRIGSGRVSKWVGSPDMFGQP